MLTEIQLRLEAHFDGLSRERLSLGYPVYVFEHGLQTAEVNSIRRELCSQLARARILEEEYWLLWIILAAEVGYTYDGDEYWKSFSSEVPEWREFGDRDKVRHWFQYFSTRYSGFNPSGRWAEHFTIIAWPITHSILPRYLQLQFVKHLYDLRYDLALKGDVDTDQLGELLGERYHGGSSRFENFLQQTALTTRLVLALRDEDVQDTTGPIYRPTLSRIVADMEIKGSSRGYLHSARRVLRDARVQAQSGLVGQAERGTQPSYTESIKSASEGITLVGRQSSADSWTLGVALPDFTALLKRAEPSEALLEKTRMRFFDKPDGWMPSRAIRSYSGRDHPLSKLPTPNMEPIIQFEDPSYDVNGLSQKLKILTHSPWLLRLHEDGVAREVLGNHVRTGEQYLIATTDPIASDIVIALNLQLKNSRTKEVILHSMGMPKSVTQVFLDALSKLNFGYALRARVEPIGLVPRWNAALGSSVWLPNEEILFRLSAEFEVTEFAVTLDAQKTTRFPIRERKEILISLGMLPLGRHVIEITAAAANNPNDVHTGRPIVPETIFVEVRPPIPWQQGILPQAGLFRSC